MVSMPRHTDIKLEGDDNAYLSRCSSSHSANIADLISARENPSLAYDNRVLSVYQKIV